MEKEIIEQLINLKNTKLMSFMSLDRQWLRADRVRDQFFVYLNNPTEVEAIKNNPQTFYLTNIGIFMEIWYGLLFSVLEGFKERKIDISSLDVLSDYEELYRILKNNRHAIFHTTSDYWDKRNEELIKLNDASSRIHTVHEKVGEILNKVLNGN